MEAIFRLKQLTGVATTIAFNLGGALPLLIGPITIQDVRGDAVQLIGGLVIPYNSIIAFI